MAALRLAMRSRLFKIAFVLVYFDQFASRIVNADHRSMRAATVLGVIDCIPVLIRPRFNTANPFAP